MSYEVAGTGKLCFGCFLSFLLLGTILERAGGNGQEVVSDFQIKIQFQFTMVRTGSNAIDI
jgi:hypothetical protein